MSNSIYATSENTIRIDSSNVDISGSLNVTGNLSCNELTSSSNISCSGLTSSSNISCSGLTASSNISCSQLTASNSVSCSYLTVNTRPVFNHIFHQTLDSRYHPLFDANGQAGLEPNVNAADYPGATIFAVNWVKVGSRGVHTYRLRIDTLTNLSDDRVKHNEIIITNGLEIMRQLQPQKYQKTNNLYPIDYSGNIGDEWKWESGFIAQDILNISDLSYVVSGGDFIDVSGNYIERPYYLNGYRDIFVYNVAAIKELDTIVENQQSTINNLTARIANLESRLSSLESS